MTHNDVHERSYKFPKAFIKHGRCIIARRNKGGGLHNDIAIGQVSLLKDAALHGFFPFRGTCE